MPYTMDDFLDEVLPEMVEELSREKRKQVLRKISADELIEALSENQGLSPEEMNLLQQLLAKRANPGAD